MDVAKTVEINVKIRVIVAEDAPEDKIAAKARKYFYEQCERYASNMISSLGESIGKIEEDKENPATEDERGTLDIFSEYK